MGRLLVRFPADRPVFVDHGEFGRTNLINDIANGIYDVDLGNPQDHTPRTQEVRVVTLGVKKVIFERLGPLAAAATKKTAPKKTTAKKKAAKRKTAKRKVAKKKTVKKKR